MYISISPSLKKVFVYGFRTLGFFPIVFSTERACWHVQENRLHILEMKLILNLNMVMYPLLPSYCDPTEIQGEDKHHIGEHCSALNINEDVTRVLG